MSALSVVFWLMVTAMAVPPSQQRDVTRPIEVGTASVSGRVMTSGDTPQPVRRAIVSLYGDDQPLGHHTVTDDQGRFTIEQLVAGKYSLSAKRPSFVTVAYGATRPGWPGTPIMVEGGQHLVDLDVRLTPGAVIAGAVRDLDGGVVSGIDVLVERRERVPAGQARTQVRTDDRGRFRVFGLAPGTYIVSAQPRRTFADQTRVPTDTEVDAILLALQRREGRSSPADSTLAAVAAAVVSDFVPVYHPDAFTADDAVPIVVRAGEERMGVDLSLRLMSSSRIAGRILGGDGRPMSTVQLSLTRASRLRVMLPQSGQVQAEGLFQFSSVAPGRYLVAAIAPPPAGGQGDACAFATEEVIVIGGELAGLLLPLRPCLKLDVHLMFDDGPAIEAKPDVAGIRVTLQPDLATGTPMYQPLRVPPRPRPDGRLTLGASGEVLPGAYYVRAELPPGTIGRGWWLRSATADGKDILDGPLVLTGSSPETTSVVLTFASQPASLSGQLEVGGPPSAREYTVIAFPTNRDWWRAPFRRIRAVKLATNGQYRMDDLPPGDYYLAALVEVAPDDWLDSVFLEQVVREAIRVSVGSGEQKIQDLRIRR